LIDEEQPAERARSAGCSGPLSDTGGGDDPVVDVDVDAVWTAICSQDSSLVDDSQQASMLMRNVRRSGLGPTE
jgi:hypothetical protein